MSHTRVRAMGTFSSRGLQRASSDSPALHSKPFGRFWSAGRGRQMPRCCVHARPAQARLRHNRMRPSLRGTDPLDSPAPGTTCRPQSYHASITRFVRAIFLQAVHLGGACACRRMRRALCAIITSYSAGSPDARCSSRVRSSTHVIPIARAHTSAKLSSGPARRSRREELPRESKRYAVAVSWPGGTQWQRWINPLWRRQAPQEVRL